MKFHRIRTGLLAFAVCTLLGCTEPPVPPEIQDAFKQDQDLWRAGALVHAPEPYRHYVAALQVAREQWAQEKNRFVWFRDYAPVADNFRQIMQQGEQVQAALLLQRQQKAEQAKTDIERIDCRARALRKLVTRIKDRRLSRGYLVTAEVALDQAKTLSAAKRAEEAQKKADVAEKALNQIANVVRPILARYTDPQQINQWRRQVDEAIAESKRSGGEAIVVSKLDRELILYRAGKAVRTYPAGLGFNALADKLRSGDKATPEGRYRVVLKKGASRYYLALLLDYPNEEDRRQFLQAQRKGRIPANAVIGGLIQIHGGGIEGMTNGCVALDNQHIKELFDNVEVGTPIVIVGTLHTNNIASEVLACLK